jgi:hypothetical protein
MFMESYQDTRLEKKGKSIGLKTYEMTIGIKEVGEALMKQIGILTSGACCYHAVITEQAKGPQISQKGENEHYPPPIPR